MKRGINCADLWVTIQDSSGQPEALGLSGKLATS
jgi:hypothetical protein